jgi:shikimate kinase
VSEERHVVLVGLMGAGKSSVGRLLAHALNEPFLDTDALIEHDTGSAVSEIFSSRGEAAFRALELEALRKELAVSTPSVIATGGGVVSTPEGRALLVAHTPVVFLDVSAAVAASRVGDARSRPLIAEDPLGRLHELSAERRAHYLEVATHVIEVDQRTPSQVVGALLALLGVAA